MAEVITSLQNPRVKAAAKLRDRRQREKQRRIIIDGVREISRAVAAGVELVEAYCCLKLCQDAECQKLLASIRAGETALYEVTGNVFAKLAYGERAEGIVAIAQTPRLEIDQFQLPSNPLVAVLEGVEKPGNLGAILRSADGAGISAVIVADGFSDLFNPNAIRASLGTIFSLQVCATSSQHALEWLKAQRLNIFAARVDANLDYDAVDFTGGAAVVLGSEADGLSRIWHDPAITPIRLPMLGIADSLNVSASAAVLFYEALRQRRRASSPFR